MERSSITRLVSKFVDMDGTSHRANQPAADQAPTVLPIDTPPSVNAFTNDVGDHTGQENPVHVAAHSLPDSISAEERATINQLLDKMLECVNESQRGYHDSSNSNSTHVTPAASSQPPANEAQGATPLIDPRLPYWYGI